MARATAKLAMDVQRETLAPPPGSVTRSLELAFQFTLIWLVAGSIWSLYGPEPQTGLAFRIRVGGIATGYCLAAVFWIASAQWSSVTKSVGVAASILFTIAFAAKFVNEFDGRSRVLEPPRIKQGRVFHEGLNVSYSVPSGYRINLQPLITRSDAPQSSRISNSRIGLRFGEMAIISRLVEAKRTPETDRSPASIILEVQRDSMTDLNAFILDGRQKEAKWAAVPHIKIVRQTHVSHIAGIDMVEFEFVEEPQQLHSRQVYLRTSGFVLNIMLNSENEADQRLFEEFLNSIRIGSAE